MNDNFETQAMPSDADSRQWLAQALAAEQAGDAETAFALLKRSIATADASPLAHHLAAAEFAQRGDTANALLHFTRALERAPDLHVARLQLALLWLVEDSPVAAAATLRPLLGAPPVTSIEFFASGLHALTRVDVPAAIAALDRGVALGSDNAALLDDMRKLRTRLAAAVPPTDVDDDLTAARHGLAIGAYENSGDPRS
jgi:tetratricopeptide (TPR) repeat protein